MTMMLQQVHTGSHDDGHTLADKIRRMKAIVVALAKYRDLLREPPPLPEEV